MDHSHSTNHHKNNNNMLGVQFLRAWVSDDPPDQLLGDSMWVFLLSRRFLPMTLALATVALQWLILRAFVIHTDIELYSSGCDDNGNPVCTEWELSVGTLALVCCILGGWTMADIAMGGQLLVASLLGVRRQNNNSNHHWSVAHRFQLFLAGLVALGIGNGTLWSALFHILDNSTSDLDALLNVVGILYVMDIDEALFSSLSRLAPHWHARMLKEIQDDFPQGLNGMDPSPPLSDNGPTKVAPPPPRPEQPTSTSTSRVVQKPPLVRAASHAMILGPPARPPPVRPPPPHGGNNMPPSTSDRRPPSNQHRSRSHNNNASHLATVGARAMDKGVA